MVNRERLLKRFLEFVKIDTTANADADCYPSSEGQRALGVVVARHLEECGLADVKQDEFALVSATIPSNLPNACPVVALNSHLDTSPETTGAGVKPQVIESYAGGDIQLTGDSSKTITVSDCPDLKDLVGKTLITTDGTTLLGGDDKAGVAIIVELAAFLMEHPEIKHGDIRVLFTCDEEIGRGVDKVNMDELAADVCYTLDGPGANAIDVETFSADEATVTFTGINIHPAIASDRMINAIRAAGSFLDRLPRETLAPESTDGRDGFLHPYRILDGQVDKVVLKVLLRDFDTPRLEEHAELLRTTAAEVRELHPGCEIEVAVRQQYRNLGEGLAKEPRAVEFAKAAFGRLNREVSTNIIRGGTDGSRFTELGLPTPNLSSGQHNIHSPLEFACLDEMVQAVEVLVELVQVWAAAE